MSCDFFFFFVIHRQARNINIAIICKSLSLELGSSHSQALFDLPDDLADAFELVCEPAQEHAIHRLAQAARSPQPRARTPAVENPNVALALPDDGADPVDDGGDVVDAGGRGLPDRPHGLVGEDDGRVSGDGVEHGADLDLALADGEGDGLGGDRAGRGDLADADEGDHALRAHGGGLAARLLVRLAEDGAALCVAQLDDRRAHGAEAERGDFAGVRAEILPEAVLSA